MEYRAMGFSLLVSRDDEARPVTVTSPSGDIAPNSSSGAERGALRLDQLTVEEHLQRIANRR